MPDQDMDAVEQVVPDSDLGTTDSALESSETAEASVETPISDEYGNIPEEYREEAKALIETRAREAEKSFQSDYTRKTQALAEKERALEADRQALAAPRDTQPQPVDPLADADWESGWTQDGRPVSQVMYEQQQTFMQNLVSYLQQRDGRLSELDSHFTEQQRAEQIGRLKSEYGEFDEAELTAAAKAAPGVPLEYVAAKVLADNKVHAAVDKALGNRTVKRQATPIGSSAAKTTPNVDTTGWDIAKHADFARRNPGVRL